MGAFHGGKEAKEFLISKIVAEAKSQHVALSEVERKMLYFTESGSTLPDMMEVSAAFDSEYDQDVYEQKIAGVVAKTYKLILKGSRDEYDKWWAAICFLQREDHYISVIIALANLRPRGDQLKLLAVGVAIVTCILLWVILSHREIFFTH